MTTKILGLLAVGLLAGSVTSNAAPVQTCNAGQCTVLDAATSTMWIYDWSLSGDRDWSGQMAWADSLVYGGFSDWRLATDGDVFALLDANGNSLSVLTTYFTGTSDIFWTPNEVNGSPGFYTTFNGATGGTGGAQPDARFGGIAVRTVTPTASVPEPGTLALLGLGLAGLGLSRRRKAA